MEDDAKGQVTRSAAEIYEEFFVPALFSQWAVAVADAARLESGQKVLDVGSGTGVLAREAMRRVGPGGTVIGLDRNEGMLGVARRRGPGIEWRVGRAESLPFEDRAFDAVVSQFGLMFFDDAVQALGEMWRVLRTGGRLVVAVWDTLEHSPGYAAMVALLDRLFGPPIANELRAPFRLGRVDALGALFDQAGICGAEIRTPSGIARFPSIEEWVRVDVKGWTLADRIDEKQYQMLRAEAKGELARFVGSDGAVTFANPAHIVTATKI